MLMRSSRTSSIRSRRRDCAANSRLLANSWKIGEIHVAQTWTSPRGAFAEEDRTPQSLAFTCTTHRRRGNDTRGAFNHQPGHDPFHGHLLLGRHLSDLAVHAVRNRHLKGH